MPGSAFLSVTGKRYICVEQDEFLLILTAIQIKW